jgi:hypothetical protein
MSKGQGTIISSSEGQSGSARVASFGNGWPKTNPINWTNPNMLKDPDGNPPNDSQTWQIEWTSDDSGYTLSAYISG